MVGPTVHELEQCRARNAFLEGEHARLMLVVSQQADTIALLRVSTLAKDRETGHPECGGGHLPGPPNSCAYCADPAPEELPVLRILSGRCSCPDGTCDGLTMSVDPPSACRRVAAIGKS